MKPELVLNPLLEKMNKSELHISGFESPSLSEEIPSSATNSPPDTVFRVRKLNDKLAKHLEQ